MWLDILVRMKKESGKTIKQISEESRVPLGTLNKLFSGQTKDPKVETLRAVVYSLGYTLDDLEQKKSPGLIQETQRSFQSASWSARLFQLDLCRGEKI